MICEITDLAQPGLEVFASMTEAELRNRLDPGRGIFIAESPKVIRLALEAGLEPTALLCERRHIEGDAAAIIAACPPEMPVFTGDRELLARLTGFTLTRGVLCAMRRPPLPSLEVLCEDARRVAVLDGVVDSTNIGAIFRSAAALGVDAVVVTPTSCDPLNRRVVRVSMGTVFQVPWTEAADAPARLSAMGFTTVALALTDKSVSIDDPVLTGHDRLALILGSEGWGLDADVIADADFTARIPMAHNVDSLNVGAAAAVAFWQLRQR